MTVVIAYLPDQHGQAALRAGVEEARRRGEPAVVVDMTRDDADDTARDALDAARAELAESGLDLEVAAAGDGADPAELTLDTADERGASVIVIGLRHRTPVGKLLLGSNAQRILLGATCPVLSVKP